MRRPPWQREGHEPDYRFSLANERTFLAWMRTALALLAGAVLFDQVAARLPSRTFIPWLAVGASAFAALMCVMAYRRWKANEIAMRHDQPLPSSAIVVVVASIFVAAAVLISFILLRH